MPSAEATRLVRASCQPWSPLCPLGLVKSLSIQSLCIFNSSTVLSSSSKTQEDEAQQLRRVRQGPALEIPR